MPSKMYFKYFAHDISKTTYLQKFTGQQDYKCHAAVMLLRQIVLRSRCT